MKILAQALPGNTIAGFRLAAEAAGHTWRWWDDNREATFDVFDEFQPDVVFFMEPTRPLKKCAKENNTPGVLGFYDKPFTFEMINCKAEFPMLVIGGLVDTQMFSPGDLHPAYECDLGITCSPHPIGLHLCRNIGEHNIKIICEETWNIVQYLGMGSLEQKRDLYRSAKFVLVDNLLEAMRVVACGSIPIPVVSEFGFKEFDERCETADTADDVLRIMRDKQYQRVARPNLKSCLNGCSYNDVLKVILENIQ